MTVLVSAASKHGSTAEIARVIGRILEDHGVPVDLRPAENVASVTGYEAVVLGSGVYAGHWLDAAKRVVQNQAGALRDRPVWLFSSGPVGDPPKPEEDPVDVAALVGTSGALEHRVFAGKLDRRSLGFAEKAVVVALRAPTGDFRDWAAIEAWAAHIADELKEGT